MDVRKGNSYDPEALAHFVGRVERIEEQKLSIMMEAVAACRPLTEKIKEVIDSAFEQGVPRRPLKAVLKARRHEGKAEEVREKLPDEESREAYDLMREALVVAASSPAPEAPTDPDREAAERNTELLREGIKPMPEEDDDPRPGFLRRDGSSP